MLILNLFIPPLIVLLKPPNAFTFALSIRLVIARISHFGPFSAPSLIRIETPLSIAAAIVLRNDRGVWLFLLLAGCNLIILILIHILILSLSDCEPERRSSPLGREIPRYCRREESILGALRRADEEEK